MTNMNNGIELLEGKIFKFITFGISNKGNFKIILITNNNKGYRIGEHPEYTSREPHGLNDIGGDIHGLIGKEILSVGIVQTGQEWIHTTLAMRTSCGSLFLKWAGWEDKDCKIPIIVEEINDENN